MDQSSRKSRTYGVRKAKAALLGSYLIVITTVHVGTTEDLSDNPRERQDPIKKCGNAAQLYNFEVFTLAVGFCISGSNNVREYQYIETDVCEGGIGEVLSIVRP